MGLRPAGDPPPDPLLVHVPIFSHTFPVYPSKPSKLLPVVAWGVSILSLNPYRRALLAALF